MIKGMRSAVLWVVWVYTYMYFLPETFLTESVRALSSVGTTPSIVVVVIGEYVNRRISVPTPAMSQNVVFGPNSAHSSKSVLRM